MRSPVLSAQNSFEKCQQKKQGAIEKKKKIVYLCIEHL